MEKHAHARKRRLIGAAIVAAAFVTILLAAIALVIANSWYLSDNNGTVGIYQGVTGDVFGIPLSHLTETSSVQVSDLPSSTQDSLRRGLPKRGTGQRSGSPGKARVPKRTKHRFGKKPG